MEGFTMNMRPFTDTENWQTWKRDFENMVVGFGIENADRKKALLLHFGGEILRDTYDSLVDGAIPFVNDAEEIPEEDEEDDDDEGANEGIPNPNAGAPQASPYEIAVNLLTSYFDRERNLPFERHIFRSINQLEGERIDNFIVRLRKQAKRCGFTNVQEEIRDQIIDKGSARLRRKFLEKRNITLAQIIRIAHVDEDIETQSRIMNETTPAVSQVNEMSVECSRCGRRDHTAKEGDRCPASGRICRKCNRRGHFEIKCWIDEENAGSSWNQHNQTHNNNNDRENYDSCNNNRATNHQSMRFANSGGSRRRQNSGQVCEVNQQSEEEKTEYAFAMSHVSQQFGEDGDTDSFVNACVGGVKLTLLIDSGTTCNVIDQDTWEFLKQKSIKCASRKCEKLIKTYANRLLLSTIGEFDCTVAIEGLVQTATFLVIKEKAAPILGKSSAKALGVLTIGLAARQQTELYQNHTGTKDEILNSTDQCDQKNTSTVTTRVETHTVALHHRNRLRLMTHYHQNVVDNTVTRF
jgi:hypothetical protein